MPKTNGGTAAFHANIADMKALGAEHRERRAFEARGNDLAHLSRMNERGNVAAMQRQQRASEGVSRRDTHNAELREAKARRDAHTESMKTRSLRALG